MKITIGPADIHQGDQLTDELNRTYWTAQEDARAMRIQGEDEIHVRVRHADGGESTRTWAASTPVTFAVFRVDTGTQS